MHHKPKCKTQYYKLPEENISNLGLAEFWGITPKHKEKKKPLKTDLAPQNMM